MGGLRVVYGALFLTSVAYALVLQLAWKRYSRAFDECTWLTVVVGVGYVLLYLRLLISGETWETVCWAFFCACLPIIARSVLNNLRRRKADLDFLARRGEDDSTKAMAEASGGVPD